MKNIAYLGRCGPETAVQSDREWFARNPHRTYRIRREIPGEFPTRRRRVERTKWTVWTLVKQLEPGLRARASYGVLRGAEPIDTDRAIGPLFEYVIRSDAGPINMDSPAAGILVNAFLPPMQGVA
jgi:hypothetical protein